MPVLLSQQKTLKNKLIILLEYLRKGYDDDNVVNNIIAVIACGNEEHYRIDGYCAEWLPRYLDLDFFRLYRMTKTTFYKLFEALECQEKFYVGGGHPVPMEQALLMTISWLGKGETLIRIGEIFNVACSTVYGCTEYILFKLLALKKKVIVWPNVREMITVEAEFRERSGFPGRNYKLNLQHYYLPMINTYIYFLGVIGAVDVCNIKFKPPKQQQASYCDKNKNHSIKLQGIVTANKVFSNIMVGYPGSAHDSRVCNKY